MPRVPRKAKARKTHSAAVTRAGDVVRDTDLESACAMARRTRKGNAEPENRHLAFVGIRWDLAAQSVNGRMGDCWGLYPGRLDN